MTVKKVFPMALILTFTGQFAFAGDDPNYLSVPDGTFPVILLALIAIPMVFFIARLLLSFQKAAKETRKLNLQQKQKFDEYFRNLEPQQIGQYLEIKNSDCCGDCKKDGSNCRKMTTTAMIAFFILSSFPAMAQDGATDLSLMNKPGIIITIVLLLIPVILGVIYSLVKIQKVIKDNRRQVKINEAKDFARYLENLDSDELRELEKRKHALDYSLTNNELSGGEKPIDEKGIIRNATLEHEIHFTAMKKKAAPRPALAPDITKLILWYLGLSAFWLVLGTGVGEYVGIKFIAPDADNVSWLSFGRLRPVHTNLVFWGWASLGMLGLGYYVVPMVSNTKIYSIRWGWIALVCINIMIVAGTICLMAGINNGGGEFREYIWPVMAFFAVGLILTLANFVMTVAKRTTKEIYISNWYIVSAIIFTIIVALTAYLPFWQDGIGETIVQGYFMHSGVGMWFTLYTLGLLYYFIPQQINKPIYAYSLGILAFWTQILFYTIIGTHHFVFSAIPWWLQTVAIVGSAGMIIPVVAATINYVMTFKGQWHKVANSYTLPFFLVAVVYYFIVSMQGTAEAFRFTNLLWHFTDFTVGHAHLGFYGIITFALWGGMYAIVPRLTGKEPGQHLVGAHFWLAFIGVLFYAIPISIGGSLRGLMWMEGKPFIDSVVMMFDWWLWRAIGGSLMFISHLVFAYNFYKMVSVKNREEIDVPQEAIKQLELTPETI